MPVKPMDFLHAVTERLMNISKFEKTQGCQYKTELGRARPKKV